MSEAPFGSVTIPAAELAALRRDAARWRECEEWAHVDHDHWQIGLPYVEGDSFADAVDRDDSRRPPLSGVNHMDNWRRKIIAEMSMHKESWTDVISCTITHDELDEEFDDGWGQKNGKSFTLWTNRRVYFPTEYDGSEDVASVSRHPDGLATEHI